MYCDTHVHFDEYNGEAGIESTITRALAVDVSGIVAVGGSIDCNALAIEAAKLFPETVCVALGFDRNYATRFSHDVSSVRDLLNDEIEKALSNSVSVAAIGEIGLDFYYSADTAESQIALMREQCAVAEDRGLPIIVHSRDAEEATIAELNRYVEKASCPDRAGVLHCFTGDEQFARCILDMGLYVSFSGIVTFANASSVRAAVSVVPDNRLLIETDSPYLAPVPLRGHRNEPAYIVHVAETLAQIRGCSVVDIARITLQNARNLFGIDINQNSTRKASWLS
ncbi:MAG: TatD family hydrolase [Lentisphaerae bacterium]|nr:TatD family hydrolase [Lentisphaerota bacterium]